MQRYVILGQPKTKKNSQMILRDKHGRPFVAPSAAYKKYEKEAVFQLISQTQGDIIKRPVNVQTVFYLQEHRATDLVNLQEAALDILVKAWILSDDNCRIVASMDGSRVLYDKERPRVEITITELEGGSYEPAV